MGFNQIEKLRLELETALPNLLGKTKLFKISEFYSILIGTNDSNLIAAYSMDFIKEFLEELKLYSPFSQAPQLTESLLIQLKLLRSIPVLRQYGNEFDEIIQAIGEKVEDFKNILSGFSGNSKTHNLTFPLIETLQDNNNAATFGTLESVHVKINITKGPTRFIFIPTEKKIEERLLVQAKISYELSIEYFLRHKKKIGNNHEVLIYFENLSGKYEGNSLGVALTIGFIEQLSILYNLPFITNIKSNIATTGGVDKFGNIHSVSKEIIEQKIDVVFYSGIETFIIPKEDVETARERKNYLKQQYPYRKLNLVAIEDIKELLNRRDLVDIKKQPKIIRTAKSIKKHWRSSVLFIVLLIGISFVEFRDFDDNPSYVWHNGNTYFYTNKTRKVLFKKTSNSFYPDGWSTRFCSLLIDIDSDGKNEVILANDITDKNINRLGVISCFNQIGEIIWAYQFKDSVLSKRENLGPPFDLQIIDTITVRNQKRIYLIAHNRYSYPGAIFYLDLKTGKRTGETFWNSGHFTDGIFIRENATNKKQLITCGCNNGLERPFMMMIDVDSLSGQAISRNDYLLNGIPLKNPNRYITLPNTDLNQLNQRFSLIWSIQLSENDHCITAASGEQDNTGGILYRYYYDENDFHINIQDGFRVQRDLQVKKGILKPPFTDTNEYRDFIKNQIRYWNGKKFVMREEL